MHDAKILSVSELEFAPDWKSKHPRRNCLEICLDGDNALYEQDIYKIRFYNYKIKTTEVDINEFEKTWWIGDTLKQLSNNHYLLEINIGTAKGNHKQFVVEFEFPEIQRK